MTSPKLAKYVTDGNDQGRYYVSPTTGNHFPSVTSVLRLVAKDFSQYAANEVAKWCVANWMELGRKSEDRGYNQARFRWKDSRNDRAEVGNGVHQFIENLHTDAWEFPELDEEQTEIIQRFYELREQYVIEPVLTEFQCFNEEFGYAGTADGLWVIDGKRFVIDVKTSKSVYPEHWMQLAALGACPIYFEEGEGETWTEREVPEFDSYAIIHLRADHAEIIFAEDDEMPLYLQEFLDYTRTWHTTDKRKKLQKIKLKKREEEAKNAW